jgi:hypothetical protein
MAIEYAMLFTTTTKKDKTGMYTYTCNKRGKEKPVRKICSAGLDTETNMQS